MSLPQVMKNTRSVLLELKMAGKGLSMREGRGREEGGRKRGREREGKEGGKERGRGRGRGERVKASKVVFIITVGNKAGLKCLRCSKIQQSYS